jgi:hypothetical protein
VYTHVCVRPSGCVRSCVCARASVRARKCVCTRVCAQYDLFLEKLVTSSKDHELKLWSIGTSDRDCTYPCASLRSLESLVYPDPSAALNPKP